MRVYTNIGKRVALVGEVKNWENNGIDFGRKKKELQKIDENLDELISKNKQIEEALNIIDECSLVMSSGCFDDFSI